jgi:hypothetical protein
MLRKVIGGKVIQHIDPETKQVVSQEFVPSQGPVFWEADKDEELPFPNKDDEFPITLEQPEKDLDNRLKEILENLPEHSLSMPCTKWDYENCFFVFRDIEEEADNLHKLIYEVDLPKWRKGYYILKQKWQEGKYHFCGVETPADWEDLCCWDACIIDALIQCSIFGEVIYG